MERDRAAMFYEKAIDVCSAAVALDDNGDGDSAVKKYISSCDYFIAGYRVDNNPARRSLVIGRVRSFVARAEALKSGVCLRTQSAPTKMPLKAAPPMPKRRSRTLSGATGIASEKIRFADVVGLEYAKQELVQSVILPQRQPHLFTGARKPHSGILLYGPPGTGKTMLAKALAAEAGCSFIAISSSDVMSKWQGDSERAVREVFRKARAQAPCVIFIDEVDSIGRQRTEGEKASLRRVKTELLTQMDGIGSNNRAGGVVVLGASNTPWELDAALRRRFQKRIYTPLPDVTAREQILRLSMEGTHVSLTGRDYKSAAQQTEGFSSSDISTLAREALMGPVRRCLRSTYFREVERLDGRKGVAVEPCGRWDFGATKIDIWSGSFDPMLLQAPAVTSADMQAALLSVKSTVGPQDLEKCARFTSQFGTKEANTASRNAKVEQAASSARRGSGFFGFFKNLFSWQDAENLPEAPIANPSHSNGRRAGLASRRHRQSEENEPSVICRERVATPG